MLLGLFIFTHVPNVRSSILGHWYDTWTLHLECIIDVSNTWTVPVSDTHTWIQVITDIIKFENLLQGSVCAVAAYLYSIWNVNLLWDYNWYLFGSPILFSFHYFNLCNSSSFWLVEFEVWFVHWLGCMLVCVYMLYICVWFF